MQKKTAGPATIAEYSRGFPRKAQSALRQIRRVIKEEAPEAKEDIRYGMPAATLRGHYLVYFAAYERHIGIYPVPEGTEALRRRLRPYRSGRGTLRFSMDKPLPIDLIRNIVKALSREVKEKWQTGVRPKQRKKGSGNRKA